MPSIRLTFYEAVKCCGVCGQTNAAVGDQFNLEIDTVKYPGARTPIRGTVTAVGGPQSGDPPNTVVGYTLAVDERDMPDGVEDLDNCDLIDVDCASCCDINSDRITDLEQDFSETLVYAASLSWDPFLLDRSVTLTLTGDADLPGLVDPTPGIYSILVIQDGVGGHDLTLSLTGDSDPVNLDQDPAGRTVVKIHYDGTSFHLLEARHELRLDRLEIDLNKTLAYAASLAWDEEVLGKSVALTLTGDATLATIANPTIGQFSLLVVQDAVGSHELTLDLPGIEKDPEINLLPSGRTILLFLYDGSQYHLLNARTDWLLTQAADGIVTEARIPFLERIGEIIPRSSVAASPNGPVGSRAVYMRDYDPDWPFRWAIIVSGDHDSGTSGPRLWVSNSIESGWVSAASVATTFTDAGYADPTNTNPITVASFTETDKGESFELVFFNGQWLLFGHSVRPYASNASRQQQWVATSPDAIVWTFQEWLVTNEIGGEHTGYHNIHLRGTILMAHGSRSGALLQTGCNWYSVDGINWVAQADLFSFSTLTRFGNFDFMALTYMDQFVIDGQRWAITGTGAAVSQGTIVERAASVIPLSVDGQRIIGPPIPLLSSQVGEADEATSHLSLSGVVRDPESGKVYLVRAVRDGAGDNSLHIARLTTQRMKQATLGITPASGYGQSASAWDSEGHRIPAGVSEFLAEDINFWKETVLPTELTEDVAGGTIVFDPAPGQGRMQITVTSTNTEKIIVGDAFDMADFEEMWLELHGVSITSNEGILHVGMRDSGANLRGGRVQLNDATGASFDVSFKAFNAGVQTEQTIAGHDFVNTSGSSLRTWEPIRFGIIKRRSHTYLEWWMGDSHMATWNPGADMVSGVVAPYFEFMPPAGSTAVIRIGEIKVRMRRKRGV